MRTSKAEQPRPGTADAIGGAALPYAGQSYLVRLGILYMEQIRLTIVTELHMREMGTRQFYETIGGSSYRSVCRHFRKLVDYGWIRKVGVAVEGRGRPEAVYRSTELAVIDTETWSTIPLSVRDAFTVRLLEEMGGRLGEALGHGTADLRTDGIAVFETAEVDERGWREGLDAVERCFRAVMREQTDAKIRLEESPGQPILMVVNLAAFEVAGPVPGCAPYLPRATEISPPPWPQRIGKVFADRLDLEIVEELNHATMTPAQLHSALGGASGQTFLRRCRRLTDLGWAVEMGKETGGSLHGARVCRFRAALPDVSASDILRQIPAPVRRGRTWEAFEPFIETSVDAVAGGAFNRRLDAHLTMTPLLLDEVGCARVAKTLREAEDGLSLMEADLAKRRRRKGSGGLKAAFLLSSFQAPQHEMRR